MLTFLLAAALLTAHPSPPALGQTTLRMPVVAPFDGRQRLEDATAKVRAVAFRTEAVDWPSLSSALGVRAEAAHSAVDMLPLYRDLLTALGDGHSFVQADPSLLEAYVQQHGEALYVAHGARTSSAFVGRTDSMAEDLQLAGGTARVIVVPAMSGGGARANAAADALFNVVTAPGAICGYVVDLRGNTGGNVWPMLVGLNPLLGDGAYGVERDAAGRDTAYAQITEGSAIVLEGEYKDMAMVEANAWRPVDATDRPVALLVDAATASSGEGVAVAFQGRPLTRTFGQKTYGVASSNLGVAVADDVNLVVTVAMMVDRAGRVYPDGIVPDEPVSVDQARETALAWLQQQDACKP